MLFFHYPNSTLTSRCKGGKIRAPSKVARPPLRSGFLNGSADQLGSLRVSKVAASTQRDFDGSLAERWRSHQGLS
jgi:hypothetical protein